MTEKKEERKATVNLGKMLSSLQTNGRMMEVDEGLKGSWEMRPKQGKSKRNALGKGPKK
jgi:hypothetical protein